MLELSEKYCELEPLYILMASDKYSGLRISDFREIVMSAIIGGNWLTISREWKKIKSLELTDEEKNICIDEVSERIRNGTVSGLDLTKKVEVIREAKRMGEILENF